MNLSNFGPLRIGLRAVTSIAQQIAGVTAGPQPWHRLPFDRSRGRIQVTDRSRRSPSGY